MGIYSECSAFFDASGKDTYPVMAVAGGVAPVAKWIRFEWEWNEVLKAAKIEQFHATDFAASVGEFKHWKPDNEKNKKRRADFLASLGKAIKRNVNKLFMVAVERDAWQSVNREYLLEEAFRSPYALAGIMVVAQTRKWAKSKKIGNLKFFFEEGDEGWGGLKKLCKDIGVEPIQVPKSETPCQAADLIAWKHRIGCANSLEKLNKILASKLPDLETFAELMREKESLDKVLVRPGSPDVFGADALTRTCRNSRIPVRSKIRLVAH